MPTSGQLKSREKVRAHRERLRRRGLRPIQIWVPDIRSRTFARQAHKQSLVVAHDPHERENQDFVDAVSDWNREWASRPEPVDGRQDRDGIQDQV